VRSGPGIASRGSRAPNLPRQVAATFQNDGRNRRVSLLTSPRVGFGPPRILGAVFDEPTPAAVIEALRPDIHVKGGDYHAGRNG
jgi:hypothetical protein